MRKIAVIIGLTILVLGNYSCQPKEIVAHFKDMRQTTIIDYINSNKDKYSSFLSILQKGKLYETLSAYNPRGSGYTLFLPDNDAIARFIQQSDLYSSLEALLADSLYVADFCRYHVVNMAIKTNDFPFGAFPELTLSKDYLTVSFVSLPDTSYYVINNQAAVIKPNIELSNGYIHVINNALKPVTGTTYGWLSVHSGYSIFKAAVDITGFKDSINFNIKDKANKSLPFTLLLEHDSVFNKRGIYSLADLEKFVSPGNSNYTSITNPLYNFVAYHCLTGSLFLGDLYNHSTNYSTLSDIPLNIDGFGIEIKINQGKQNFDTIIHQLDTTIIDYVGFNYDASNIVTQSGVIHFINQILQQKPPSIATVTFEFWDEPYFNDLRMKSGTYLIENHSALRVVSWEGADLSYVRVADQPGVSAIAWSNDYLLINGDFSLTYRVQKVVQGTYTVYLAADGFNTTNAVVEVYIDGKKLGGLVDLTAVPGASATRPFPYPPVELGDIEFLKYEVHDVEVRALIPGRFCWDYIQFVPK